MTSGSAILSRDESELYIYNFFDGVDVYIFPDMSFLRTIKEERGKGYPRQMALTKGGTLLAQGSERGVVCLSNAHSGVRVRNLRHIGIRSYFRRKYMVGTRTSMILKST
jgi:hypothetical protein